MKRRQCIFFSMADGRLKDLKLLHQIQYKVPRLCLYKMRVLEYYVENKALLETLCIELDQIHGIQIVIEITLKRKCLHFDEIFITGCTESCQNDNFRCSQ